VLALSTLLGCEQSPPVPKAPGACDQARAGLPAGPASRAERAVARGDRRFVAVYGITTLVPGVSDQALIQSHGYSVLEMTSDFILDESCENYQTEAEAYARTYNLRVLELTRNP
jgi:hypothetical protein